MKTAAQRFKNVLDIQRDEAKKGDPYMVGLYNGMLLIVAGIDESEYYPMDCRPTLRTRLRRWVNKRKLK